MHQRITHIFWLTDSGAYAAADWPSPKLEIMQSQSETLDTTYTYARLIYDNEHICLSFNWKKDDISVEDYINDVKKKSEEEILRHEKENLALPLAWKDDWRNRLFERLRETAEYEDGWNGYNGMRFDDETMDTLWEFAERLRVAPYAFSPTGRNTLYAEFKNPVGDRLCFEIGAKSAEEVVCGNGKERPEQTGSYGESWEWLTQVLDRIYLFCEKGQPQHKKGD